MRERITWRSPLVVMLAFATMIGIGGLIYAHWFSEATIDGNVNTGGVSVEWVNGWTDDDGVDNGEGEGGGPANGFDYWGPESSADPSAEGRYDKDVGRCYVHGWGEQWLGVQMDNAYPSYHCTVTGLLRSSGGVPVKAIGFAVYPEDFFTIPYYLDGNDDPYYGPVCWSDNGTPDNGDDDFEYAETQEGFDGNCENSSYDEGEGDFVVTPYVEAFDVEVVGGTVVASTGNGPVLTVSPSAMCGMQIDPVNGPSWFDGEGSPYEGPVCCDNDGCYAETDESQLGENGECDDSVRDGDDFPVFESWEGTGVGAISATMHVEQAAEQNTGFQFRIHPRFVNWNEFDESLCTVELIGG